MNSYSGLCSAVEQVLLYGYPQDTKYKPAFGNQDDFESMIDANAESGLPDSLVKETNKCCLCSIHGSGEAHDKTITDQLNERFETSLSQYAFFNEMFPKNFSLGRCKVATFDAVIGNKRDLMFLIRDLRMKHVHFITYHGGRFAISRNIFDPTFFTGEKIYKFEDDSNYANSENTTEYVVNFKPITWLDQTLNGCLLPYLHQGERVIVDPIDFTSETAVMDYAKFYAEYLNIAKVIDDIKDSVTTSLYKSILSIVLLKFDDIGVLDHPKFVCLDIECIHRMKSFGELFDYTNRDYRFHLLAGLKLNPVLFDKWGKELFKLRTNDLSAIMTVVWSAFGEASYSRRFITNTFIRENGKFIIPNDEIYEIRLIDDDHKLRSHAVRQCYRHRNLQYDRFENYNKNHSMVCALNMLVADPCFDFGVFLSKSELKTESATDSRVQVSAWSKSLNWVEMSENLEEYTSLCLNTHNTLRDFCRMDQNACVQFVRDQMRFSYGTLSQTRMSLETISPIGLEMEKILSAKKQEQEDLLEKAGPETKTFLAQLGIVLDANQISTHYLLGSISAPIKAFVDVACRDLYRIEAASQYYVHLSHRTRYLCQTLAQYSTSYCLLLGRKLIPRSFRDLENVMLVSQEFTGTKIEPKSSLDSALASFLGLRSKELKIQTEKKKSEKLFLEDSTYKSMKKQIEKLTKENEEHRSKSKMQRQISLDSQSPKPSTTRGKKQKEKRTQSTKDTTIKKVPLKKEETSQKKDKKNGSRSTSRKRTERKEEPQQIVLQVPKEALNSSSQKEIKLVFPQKKDQK